GLLAWPAAALLVLALAAVALPSGIITADALRQETSQNYRLPRMRAVLYGWATSTAVAGVSFIALAVSVIDSTAVIAVGAALVIVAAGGFAGLGASQTNRSKEWTRRLHDADDAKDAFSHDPTTAARFGIYTLAIWIVAVSAFIAATLTAGFRCSSLSLIAGLVVFMVVLARMQFPRNRTGGRTDTENDRFIELKLVAARVPSHPSRIPLEVLLHARTTRILRQAQGQFSATHVRTSFINKELLMLHSSSDAAVEAVDLVKTYPSGRRSEPVRAIDTLNFSVEAGCVFGLLGPNGAGKSTTIKILSTLAHPDSGTAVVAGTD